jgi:ADP-dependent phosphofructokinase/glucokinase
MSGTDARNAWLNLYRDVPATLKAMAGVGRVVCAFNTNIDAVVKVTGSRIQAMAADAGVDSFEPVAQTSRAIRSPADLVRGLLRCFSRGIGEEWLIEGRDVVDWVRARAPDARHQMGGQAGIVANAMSLCGVGEVLVHCASLPADQAGLFLERDNLRSTNRDGIVAPARTLERPDEPMVHWILEFDGGDSVTLAGNQVTCPKSNRFIATYDPLNFRLSVDEGFAAEVLIKPADYAVVSGYHLLQEDMVGGGSGIQRVDATRELLRSWKAAFPGMIRHLEFASTQDRAIRYRVLDTVARDVESLGLNEREAIDLLEVLCDAELAAACENRTSSTNLFRAVLRIVQWTGCPRVQLHMFGLYFTVQGKGFPVGPLANRRGMQVAAVVAAGKAGTGAIDSPDVLLWADGRAVSDIGLRELAALGEYLGENHGPNSLLSTGIFEGTDFDVIAVPTILVERPVTLVGMGDTISSISLVGAR